MKKILLLGLCLWSVMLVCGQQLTYEFEYDHAGNRTRRTVIQLNNSDGDGETPEGSSVVFSDPMGGGETMKLYPNPTTESICFELDGTKIIGKYVLTDINGKPIRTGFCENTSLTLDLSAQSKGVYLFELFVDEKPHLYKVIKQ